MAPCLRVGYLCLLLPFASAAVVEGPRTAGGSGVRASGGTVAADLAAGHGGGGVAAGGAVRLLPGYVGQVYDVRALPLAVDPAEVPEGGAGQLAAGPAVMGDGSDLPVGATAVRWAVVSGPVQAISPSGAATAGEVGGDTPATVSATFLNLTAELTFTVVDSAAPLTTFAALYPTLDPDADHNGDGLSNFTNYALGSDPLGQEPPSAGVALDGLTFTHTERMGAADVFPRYEYSTDPPNFSPMVEGQHYNILSRDPDGPRAERVTLEILYDPAATPLFIWRVAFVSGVP